uniref:BACK domain-containing protein n=1 Tax=Romanomermis culicivorax TaxID=13658 RepID=A0A915KRM4_ROMCU
MHNCRDLIANVDRFVKENFQTLRRKNLHFLQQINLEYLTQLFSDDDLNVENEEQVFETLIDWLEFEKERRQFCQDLLPKIRLTQLSMDFLMKKVLVHPIIESFCSKKMVKNVHFLLKKC